MSKKIILAVIFSIVILNSAYVGAVNINKKVDKDSSVEESPLNTSFEFTDKNALEYYNSVFGIVNNPICQKCISKLSDELNLPLGYTSGTSTVFEPPYSSCFSWGEGTPGIDEYSHGCNKYSGSIGAYTNAWIGGATAEGMQQLNFYVGRIKTVTIDAKIIRTGGKITFGFGAFSGTEKTWSWDDFQQNYHRSDVDPWWSWDFIIQKIIDLVALLIGFAPGGIAEAIELLSSIVNFEALTIQMQNMLDDGDAKILHIIFSFTANPGWHKIWVGLRCTSSACITGTASAVTMGQVSKITIDGIAAPESPTISGVSSGKVGESYQFCTKSDDPNGDNIKYYFDWGDGTNSGWTDYKSSGTNVYKSHIYSKKGNYIIKVTVEDIDKMQSESIFSITIYDKNRPKEFIISNPLIQEVLTTDVFFGQ